jgi:GxxExxY protein
MNAEIFGVSAARRQVALFTTDESAPAASESTQICTLCVRRLAVHGQEPKGQGEKRREPAASVDALARDVIGVAIEVHRVLGPGLLESIYEEALCVELELAGIPFERQVPVQVHYKQRFIGNAKLYLLIRHQLVVEHKTVEFIAPVHIAQLVSYLKFTRLSLGLLVNFNVRELRQGIKRVVGTRFASPSE